MKPERLDVIVNSLNKRQPDLTVIMENVVKSHNLAAVARTLEAVGGLDIHAITSDPRAVKLTSMSGGGIKKWIQVHKHTDTRSGIDWLKARGFQVVATHLSERAKDFRHIDYTQPTAILVGTELEGISDEAIELADENIVIPMTGLVQSLNVSVASALVLYEAYRQREAAGLYDLRRLDDETYLRLLFEACHPKVAKYCRRKQIPYPKINEQAEILEPIADSTTYTDHNLTSWLNKNKL